MTTPEHKRHPSYQSVERANTPRTRDTGVIGLHTENLFDENERVTDGAQYNEADGTPYDNSGPTDETYFDVTETGHIVDPLRASGTDVMGALRPERDEAAAWLAEHEAMIVPVDEEHQHQNVA